MNLMVVDDDQGILDFLSESFEAIKYKVFRASNGREAIDILTSHAIDIIVTDLKMPEMDGIGFLTRVNDLPHIPVKVVVSGYSDLLAELTIHSEIAVDLVFEKPINITKLQDSLKTILKRG